MNVGPESAEVIIGIGQILGLITSIVTIVITYVIERKALVRWRIGLFNALVILWFGIILIILSLIIPSYFFYYGIKFYNIVALIGIFIWIIGIIYLMFIFRHICRLELIHFSKPNLSFDEFESSFQAECIDFLIKSAASENRKLSFPVILAADESWSPWNIGLKFAEDALEKGAGVIFFTFVRPASHILNQLEIKNSANLIIIDCFTPLSYGNQTAEFRNGFLYADPRNPHDLNEKYEIALSYLSNKTNKNMMAVVYDTLSEFLFFSDKELAIQYLRHNMYWEEKHNIHSLYIFRLGTIEKFLEEYVLWFANTVICLKTEKKKPKMWIRGLFQDPRFEHIDYELKCNQEKDQQEKDMPSETRPQ